MTQVDLTEMETRRRAAEQAALDHFHYTVARAEALRISDPELLHSLMTTIANVLNMRATGVSHAGLRVIDGGRHD